MSNSFPLNDLHYAQEFFKLQKAYNELVEKNTDLESVVEQFLDSYADIKSCSNHGCVIANRIGMMGTNGSCNCHRQPRIQILLQRLSDVKITAQKLMGKE